MKPVITQTENAIYITFNNERWNKRFEIYISLDNFDDSCYYWVNGNEIYSAILDYDMIDALKRFYGEPTK